MEMGACRRVRRGQREEHARTCTAQPRSPDTLILLPTRRAPPQTHMPDGPPAVTSSPPSAGVDTIFVNVPTRLLALPAAAGVLGLLIGFSRGGRSAGLRFLAENAHRPPRTVGGWYFYNKTKNYRVLLAGGQEGARTSAALTAITVGWLVIEEGVKRAGTPWDQLTDVAAGLGTAGAYCAACPSPPLSLPSTAD
jgi:hypothetical protein